MCMKRTILGESFWQSGDSTLPAVYVIIMNAELRLLGLPPLTVHKVTVTFHNILL